MLMRGQACAKEMQADGSLKNAVSNDAVLRYLGLADSCTELRVRRLQFWQRVAASPRRHSSLLAVTFDVFAFKKNNPLDRDGSLTGTAHPWLQQLVDDIESLRDIPDTAFIPQAVDGKPLHLFFDDVKEDILRLDYIILRRQCLCVVIPPPGFQAPHGLQPLAILDDPDIHTCDMQLPDGSVCARTFGSRRALAIHQVAMQRQNKHNSPGLDFQLVVTNQCFFCRSVFENLFSTRSHVSASIQAQQCSGHGSITNRQADAPANLDCPICGSIFEAFDELHDHLEQHLWA